MDKHLLAIGLFFGWMFVLNGYPSRDYATLAACQRGIRRHELRPPLDVRGPYLDQWHDVERGCFETPEATPIPTP